ncbi:hypothetical protein B0H14DRAFT_2610092 [Mycena olivaceomarginata]|nr:hypothetical protein B0H14DRAFT_2610092 [Mycena olivaceomarginata]
MPPSASVATYVSVQSSRSMRAQMLGIYSLEAVPTMSWGEIATKWSRWNGLQSRVTRRSIFLLTSGGGQPISCEFQSLKIPWIDNLPLMTVQRTLYLLFPQDTANWSFFVDTNSKDFRYFLWSFSGPGKPTMYDAALGPVPRDLIIGFVPAPMGPF